MIKEITLILLFITLTFSVLLWIFIQMGDEFTYQEYRDLFTKDMQQYEVSL